MGKWVVSEGGLEHGNRAAGKETRALDVLGAALALVCPQGYVRVFADEGPPMAALLGGLVAPSQKTTPLRAASRSAAWPACCGGSAARTTRRAPCVLEHLATLTRDQVRFVGTRAAVPVLAEPTSAQR